MGDRIWEITGKENDFCKIRYTINTVYTIERDCFIKKTVILNGTSKIKKLADMNSQLENCEEAVIS